MFFTVSIYITTLNDICFRFIISSSSKYIFYYHIVMHLNYIVWWIKGLKINPFVGDWEKRIDSSTRRFLLIMVKFARDIHHYHWPKFESLPKNLIIDELKSNCCHARLLLTTLIDRNYFETNSRKSTLLVDGNVTNFSGGDTFLDYERCVHCGAR